MALTRRCAYLVMSEPDGFEVDIELAFPPLEAEGWRFDAVSWRSPSVRWSDFDAVYIGAAWDYPEEPQRFLDVLESIVQSGTVLVNDISLVRWTLAKTYLRDLEQRGAGIVPSLWYESFDRQAVEDAFDEFGSERIIIKPVVSTNATDTHLLTKERLAAMAAELQSIFEHRPFVIQDFIQSIQTEGEHSLFFFDGVYSHAVRKVPAEADFRVQEQYGAEIIDFEPEPDVLAAGGSIIRLVDPTPVYARVDLVRGDGRVPLLMELELIEPSMYLRKSPQAPVRFADAFNRYFNKKSGGRRVMKRTRHFALAIALAMTSGAFAEGTVQVVMSTSEGDIGIDLYLAKAPITAGNFLKLVDNGAMDGGSFYRVITYNNDNGNPKIEVIQGGLGDAGEEFETIDHETTEQTGILHTDGVISMARGAVGTASTEFFICIGEQPGLDYGQPRNADEKGFAAFGKVVSGMNVVRRINGLSADAPSDSEYTQGQILEKPVAIVSVRRAE